MKRLLLLLFGIGHDAIQVSQIQRDILILDSKVPVRTSEHVWNSNEIKYEFFQIWRSDKEPALIELMWLANTSVFLSIAIFSGKLCQCKTFIAQPWGIELLGVIEPPKRLEA